MYSFWYCVGKSHSGQSQWSKRSSCLFSRIRQRLWAYICILALMLGTLGACTKLNPVSAFIPKPDVVAQVNLGKNNTSTLGQTTNSETAITVKESVVKTLVQDTGKTEVEAQKVDTITINKTPTWIWYIVALLVLLPSPLQRLYSKIYEKLS